MKPWHKQLAAALATLAILGAAIVLGSGREVVVVGEALSE